MPQRFVGVLVACLVSIALASCGGSSDSDDDADVVETSYEPLSEETFVDAMLEAMVAHESVRIRMEMPGMRMDGVVQINTGAMRFTYSGDDPFELIAVDGAYYGREPGQTTWTEYPARMFEEAMGDLTPDAMVADLREGVEGLAYVGEDEVDGVMLHLYEFAANEEMTARQAEEAGVPVEEFPDVAYQMWLDEDHLMQEFAADMGMGDIHGWYEEWGAPVTIEAPSADELSQRRTG